jgi:hypothetical protein
VGAVRRFAEFIGAHLADWGDTSLEELHFWHRDDAWVAAIAFLAVSAILLLVRLVFTRRRRADRVGLPALLNVFAEPSFAFVRHVPLVLLLAGLPLFLLALADPYTSLTQKRTTFPGRRICLMIDASTSMVRWFDAPTLRNAAINKSSGGRSDAAFFTTIAAAERFIRLRIEGKYRDLISLVEFGDQAYVVTPFTHDYDNVLLSLSLIGDFGEFLRFPDQGTIISHAIEQGTRLFRTFDFLDASGNLLVLFSDGEDAMVATQGKPVKEVVADAVKAKIPVYMIRINHEKELGAVVPDKVWKEAVEETGGRFYAAANEATILQAIRDIDRVSVGKIDVTQYVTQRPRFGPFALAAAACWALALAMKLTVPYFRTFP